MRFPVDKIKDFDPRGWTTNRYMKYLHDAAKGSKQVRTNQRVGIIGAGMAGLVAGWLLSKSGFQIKIYEASLRVGGRIRTLREGFTNGLYAEAGAMRIPEKHELTKELCELFGLKLFSFPEESDESLVYVNKVRGQMKDYNASKMIFDKPYKNDCPPAEKLIEELLTEFKENAEFSDLYSKNALRLDEVSFGEFLRAFQEKDSEKRLGRVINSFSSFTAPSYCDSLRPRPKEGPADGETVRVA